MIKLVRFWPVILAVGLVAYFDNQFMFTKSVANKIRVNILGQIPISMQLERAQYMVDNFDAGLKPKMQNIAKIEVALTKLDEKIVGLQAKAEQQNLSPQYLAIVNDTLNRLKLLKEQQKKQYDLGMQFVDTLKIKKEELIARLESVKIAYELNNIQENLIVFDNGDPELTKINQIVDTLESNLNIDMRANELMELAAK